MKDLLFRHTNLNVIQNISN